MSPAITLASEARTDVDVTHESTRELFTAEGWSLSVWNDLADREPRVRDLDAAERLGFARPRDVRKLIERIWPENKRPHCRATVARQSTGNGASREYTVSEYWLTEAELLKVCARSSTRIADAILDDMIRVYMAVRRQLAAGVALAIPTSPARRAVTAQAQPGGALTLTLSDHVAREIRELALLAGMGVEEVLYRVLATAMGASTRKIRAGKSAALVLSEPCVPTFVMLSPEVRATLAAASRRRFGDDSPGSVSATAQSVLITHALMSDVMGASR